MDRLKPGSYQLPAGSALAVDFTTTNGSALTKLDSSSGSALVETPVGPSGSALAEGDPDSSAHGSALASSDNEVSVTKSSAALRRIPGVTEPYKHVGTREKLEKKMAWFILRPSAITLSRLYLCAGIYCPDLAKRKGVYHGLCDEHGMKAEPEVATHVGFTAGDEEEMEA